MQGRPCVEHAARCELSPARPSAKAGVASRSHLAHAPCSAGQPKCTPTRSTTTTAHANKGTGLRECRPLGQPLGVPQVLVIMVEWVQADWRKGVMGPMGAEGLGRLGGLAKQLGWGGICRSSGDIPRGDMPMSSDSVELQSSSSSCPSNWGPGVAAPTGRH